MKTKIKIKYGAMKYIGKESAAPVCIGASTKVCTLTAHSLSIVIL